MARVTISSNNLFPGPRGAQGPAGPAGGPEGPAGPQGPQGNVGPQGPQGIQGPAGPTGAGGAQGLKGDTGNKGDKGDKGDPGTNGTNGTNGAGVVVGGTTGQALTKINSTDYNTQWTTIPLLTTANTFIVGPQTVNTGGTGNIGLIVQKVSSQTANMTEWRDELGAVNAGVSSGASFFTTGRITVGFTSAQPNFKALISNNTSTTDVVFGVRAIASQTANLQEWQNSAGTVLSSVSAAGLIRVNNTNTDAMITSTGNSTYDAIRIRSAAGLTLWGAGSSNRMFFAGSGGLSMTGGSWSSGKLDVDTGAAGSLGLIVRGQPSQTANLQEWQNSAGTVLTAIGASGNLIVTNRGIFGSDINARLNVVSFSTTQVQVAVRGAASQTANLQEWQDSAGTLLGGMQSNGQLFGTQIKTPNAFVFIGEANSGGQIIFTRETAAASNPGANAATLYFRAGTNANTLRLVARAGTAGAETTIFDNIPTT